MSLTFDDLPPEIKSRKRDAYSQAGKSVECPWCGGMNTESSGPPNHIHRDWCYKCYDCSPYGAVFSYCAQTKQSKK